MGGGEAIPVRIGSGDEAAQNPAVTCFRTGHTAFFAVSETELLVDVHMTVNYTDGSCRTLSFAFEALDASGLADFHDLFTLVTGRAAYHHAGTAGNDLQNVAGACPGADAASGTARRIDPDESVAQIQGVEGAYLDAVSVAEAGICALIGSLPGTEQGGRRAGRHALIFKAHGNLALDFFTAAEGYLRFHGRNDFPGKIADLDAGFLASGDAKPCRDIRIGNNGLGIVFASGKTAAATVGAGQYFHHSLYSGVFFNGENF